MEKTLSDYLKIKSKLGHFSLLQGSVYFKLMSWGNIQGFLFSVVVTEEWGRWEWMLDWFWAAFPPVLLKVSFSCSSLQIQCLQAWFALAFIIATVFLRNDESEIYLEEKVISYKESSISVALTTLHASACAGGKQSHSLSSRPQPRNWDMELTLILPCTFRQREKGRISLGEAESVTGITEGLASKPRT